mgnify:CR=1 FL=1
MAAAKRTKATSVSRYVDMMKALGLARLDAFRRADLTPELREKAGLSAEDEHRLTAYAELGRLGLPAEVAQALSLSGAIGSASELAALTLAEVEQVLAEAPVRRLLPAEFRLDRADLETRLRLAVPLTADESAPGRTALAESEAATLARDEETALVAEELVLAPDRVSGLLDALKQRWRRAEAALAPLARAGGAPADALALRAALAELQAGIADALQGTLAPASGAFAAADETATAPFADEEADASVEVARLQGELRRIEFTIDALRAVSVGGSEAASPAAASEDGADDRETSLRGE